METTGARRHDILKSSVAIPRFISFHSGHQNGGFKGHSVFDEEPPPTLFDKKSQLYDGKSNKIPNHGTNKTLKKLNNDTTISQNNSNSSNSSNPTKSTIPPIDYNDE